MIKITYFVHSTTTDNEKGISSGWSDVELSELGKKQSIDLKDQIKGKKIDVVFCSDLKRAVDSATLIPFWIPTSDVGMTEKGLYENFVALAERLHLFEPFDNSPWGVYTVFS